MKARLLLLCVLVATLALAMTTETALVRAGQTARDGGMVLYVPLVVKPLPSMVSVPPAGSWYLNAEGIDLVDTLAGGTDQLWHHDASASVWNLPPGPGRPLYHVNRAFLSFDLSDIPAGTIVSATLELCIWDGSVRGEFDVGFYRGVWNVPPEMENWDSYGPLLGTLDTGEAVTGSEHTWVPLPGLVGQPVPDQLNLVIRGDETTELGWGDESSVRFTLWDGEPVSWLWLAVQD